MAEIRYTPDPVLNAWVARVVETLKQELVTQFHPKSIVLAGSLGRGEASVAATGDRLEFRSDAEVIIIPNWHVFTQGRLKQFGEDFYQRTGLRVSLSGVILSFELLLPCLARKIRPTIDSYDLKYGSTVIYGKNYLNRIGDIQPESIPVWEGIRLLFNRMAEALELFPRGAEPSLVYQLDKITLACQDSLLLLLHRYNPSWRERNRLFEQVFPEHFAHLAPRVPDLLALTQEATRRKLNGNVSVEPHPELWFDTGRVCDHIFRYVIEKGTGIIIKDYLDFQQRYMAYPGLKEYIRLPFGNPVCQNLWSSLRWLSLSHALPPVYLMGKLRTRWAHLIYSTIPLIYFGRLPGNEIAEPYLNRVLDVIASIEGRKITYRRPLEGWEYARRQVIDYWHKMCW